ncbi:MAG: PqqD family protein [Desulfobacteraceae bacterium]|nr:MAG: PqqD family protein [Desulfobacteraceae bacterium]
MSNNKVYRKKDEIVARKIADETILVPIRGKLADMQRIFSLNPVAEFIWAHIEKETPVEKILNLVIHEFDVEEKKAKEDLVALIDDFLTENLIEQVA